MPVCYLLFMLSIVLAYSLGYSMTIITKVSVIDALLIQGQLTNPLCVEVLQELEYNITQFD